MCKTLFDCSATGITGHFRVSQVPFKDRIGQEIRGIEEWNRSRNQQRNYETLIQLISLRSQPENITIPHQRADTWQFEFDVAAEGVFGTSNDPDPYSALYQDCIGVPMVTNLSERNGITPIIKVKGKDRNIWFETINN